MIEYTTNFIISQILMFLAICSDLISMQFKERKYIFSFLAISAALISAHLFFLDKTTAALLVFFSMVRFIICIFSTNKKFLLLFLVINTIIVTLTYSEIYDIILFIGMTIFIIGNFLENKKYMRVLMMCGTSIFIFYYTVIFSPVAIIAEILFLSSEIIGYYRFYIKKGKIDNEEVNQL